MEPLIVVGVDGSEGSRSALRWALEEARLRGAALRVVHAWYAYPAMGDGASGVATDWDALVAGANSFVESFARETVGVPEGIELEAVAVHGTAAAALIEAAQEAELLVVGSRGHGGFTGLLLGSVSQQCVHHAPCPIVIVRGAPVEPKDVHEAAAGAPIEG